jgi:hypothetical protein
MQFMVIATLPECVRLLSQLSVKELRALRRIGAPKGVLEDFEDDSNAAAAGHASSVGLTGVKVNSPLTCIKCRPDWS